MSSDCGSRSEANFLDVLLSVMDSESFSAICPHGSEALGVEGSMHCRAGSAAAAAE